MAESTSEGPSYHDADSDNESSDPQDFPMPSSGGGAAASGGARAAAKPVGDTSEDYSSRPEERRGIYEDSDASDYLTTNDKVEEVMGKVKDVLSREVLLGEGYADANVAEQILHQLTNSISVLMRDDGAAPGQTRQATSFVSPDDFDASSLTGTDVLFSENDSEVGYNPLSREEVQERRAEKGRRKIPWSLHLWDMKLVEMRSHAQTAQQKLEKRARRAALEEKRAAKREKERRQRLLEAAGYNWVGKFDSKPPKSLREWESSFGDRLRRYDEHKAASMAELEQKINAVQDKKETLRRPPRLEKVMVEVDGVEQERYGWVHGDSDRVDLVPEDVALAALDDDTWVFKRLMLRARDREEALERKKFLAQQRKAERELEECFFAPQIQTTVNTRSPKPKDRARELGYALKATAPKRKAEEESFPFSPAINSVSRRMVAADMYRSREEVINRLAQPRKVEAPTAPSDDGLGDATFQPAINTRSSNMARDVTVYDRLYNVGMQQILEKKRLQADFWDNYTRLDKPPSLRLPADPFTVFQAGEGDSANDTSFAPLDEANMTRSVALDRTRGDGGGAGRAPRSLSDVLGAGAAPGTKAQDVAIGMSPAEFLAVYSR